MDNGVGELGRILDEVDEVFSFSDEKRPQDRAHGYLERHRVQRGWNDTAMQVACADMVRRAYTAGMDEGRGLGDIDPDVLADALINRFKERALAALMKEAQ